MTEITHSLQKKAEGLNKRFFCWHTPLGMRRKFSHRCRFKAGLCLLMVLMQVLSAPVHAANMARHANGTLGFLFCGDLSPAQQEALRASLPLELQDTLERKARDEQLATNSCDLCVGLHASDLALPVATTVAQSPLGIYLFPDAPALPEPAVKRLQRPLSRGPPKIPSRA